MEILAERVVAPLATVLVIFVALLIAIFLLAALIIVGCIVTELVIRIVFSPLRFLFSKYSTSEWGTRVGQPVVAALFFCFFTSRLAPQYRFFAFFFLLFLIGLLVWIVRRVRARYRAYFSEILFDERYLDPVWDWISSQRRILLLLARLPPLRPVSGALDIVLNRVHHRRWQLFLGSLIAFSFYTLPVQLFPGFDHWLSETVSSAVKNYELDWLSHSPWFGRSFDIVAIIYLYLVDWLVTIIALYAVITFLCPLEPRNLFETVEKALRDFVSDHRIFVFSGLFWQHQEGSADFAVCARGEEEKRVFSLIAKTFHHASLDLDAHLRGGWQGENARIALTYKVASPNKAGKDDHYCLHYRRFGRSSFLVAVDANRTRFDRPDATSQKNFQQLSDSVGYLVNVRDSLK
jgi:hypothetical protein